MGPGRAYGDSYCNRDCNANTYTNGHPYGYSQANAHCEAKHNTKVATYSAAAAIRTIEGDQ